MQPDKDMLKKIQSMDNDSLSAAIKELGKAIGADQKQTERALRNVKLIKRRIASASEEDLQKAVDKIGPEKTEQIIRSLKL